MSFQQSASIYDQAEYQHWHSNSAEVQGRIRGLTFTFEDVLGLGGPLDQLVEVGLRQPGQGLKVGALHPEPRLDGTRFGLGSRHRLVSLEICSSEINSSFSFFLLATLPHSSSMMGSSGRRGRRSLLLGRVAACLGRGGGGHRGGGPRERESEQL